MKPTLLIFAKSPRMGVSKTRLAKGIGMVQAWRVKRALDAYTCRIARGQAWQTKLAIAPDQDVNTHFVGAWPHDLARVRQGRGDLGQRMARALRAHARQGVCIIGSDLPDLQTLDLTKAFQALKRHDVVLGPATDGGYWLIGMTARAARKAKLEGIRWSNASTLKDTVDALPATYKVAYLRELEDVDDAVSFARRKTKGASR